MQMDGDDSRDGSDFGAPTLEELEKSRLEAEAEGYGEGEGEGEGRV